MHIAIIPARRGSQGVPFKNRILFENTANFLDKQGWWEQVIVSTDDEVLKEKSTERGYRIHHRNEELAAGDVSIGSVFQVVVEDMSLSSDDWMWLFYLPIPYKSEQDFNGAKMIVEEGNVKSLCSFMKAKTHPYYCWQYDESQKKLSQYIENECCRRQDQPPAWEHFHYVYCTKVSEVKHLNPELLNQDTVPIFLSEETSRQLVEIDTPQDLELWKRITAESKS